jgi:endonuclease/exonuclease/phosphatase family metal-dependent hydrolase
VLLKQVSNKISSTNEILLMGEFNARVGREEYCKTVARFREEKDKY